MCGFCTHMRGIRAGYYCEYHLRKQSAATTLSQHIAATKQPKICQIPFGAFRGDAFPQIMYIYIYIFVIVFLSDGNVWNHAMKIMREAPFFYNNLV